MPRRREEQRLIASRRHSCAERPQIAPVIPGLYPVKHRHMPARVQGQVIPAMIYPGRRGFPRLDQREHPANAAFPGDRPVSRCYIDAAESISGALEHIRACLERPRARSVPSQRTPRLVSLNAPLEKYQSHSAPENFRTRTSHTGTRDPSRGPLAPVQTPSRSTSMRSSRSMCRSQARVASVAVAWNKPRTTRISQTPRDAMLSPAPLGVVKLKMRSIFRPGLRHPSRMRRFGPEARGCHPL